MKTTQTQVLFLFRTFATPPILMTLNEFQCKQWMNDEIMSDLWVKEKQSQLKPAYK